jgi:hypothetical protein
LLDKSAQVKIIKINCFIQMNYKHDYMRSPNPLQNYYSNIPMDAKSQQIKKYHSLHSESRAKKTSLS